MKTVIVYTSKTGTTEKCANIVASKLTNVKMVNLKNEEIDIKDYDLVLIGSPIRMGMIDKSIKKFITDNYNTLLQKKVAYFLCCGFNENWRQYYEQNISKDLLEKAVIYVTFGGEMSLEKQKGIDKFIVKMVAKNIDKNIQIKIIEDNIEEFIKKVNEIR